MIGFGHAGQTLARTLRSLETPYVVVEANAGSVEAALPGGAARHVEAVELPMNEKVVVCGPSGSGKSTMIRCINRLEKHQEGTIIIDGTELTDDMRKIEKVRRSVGMVFQSFNLFPPLSVIENLTMAPFYVHGIQ